MNQQKINRYLDHAVLKPEMNRQEVVDAIQLGIDYQVKTVCVMPCYIDMALAMCSGTESGVSCVLGFPHGNALSAVKAAEAQLYTAMGVAEIDMVANYSFIKSGEWDRVFEDIQAVAAVTKSAGVPLKVILETALLAPEEIARATESAIEAQADYVKTSTGFNGGGASAEAVGIMLETAKGRVKVKASGGIRNAETAQRYIAMGCHRLGNNYSFTPAICTGAEAEVKDSGSY